MKVDATADDGRAGARQRPHRHKNQYSDQVESGQLGCSGYSEGSTRPLQRVEDCPGLSCHHHAISISPGASMTIFVPNWFTCSCSASKSVFQRAIHSSLKSKDEWIARWKTDLEALQEQVNQFGTKIV